MASSHEERHQGPSHGHDGEKFGHGEPSQQTDERELGDEVAKVEDGADCITQIRNTFFDSSILLKATDSNCIAV
jgi:hypothetical protein